MRCAKSKTRTALRKRNRRAFERTPTLGTDAFIPRLVLHYPHTGERLSIVQLKLKNV